MNNTEKEDGICENKLCDELAAQCSISSSGLTLGIDSINNKNNNTDDISVCANCGKKGIDNDMNTCNKCKQVKYCNAVCKKVHKKKHKKECEKHIRLETEKHNEELRIAAELHDIELFKQPPSEEDCPICFLRLPTLNTGWNYMACCGKRICTGCLHAMDKIDKEGKCPFCRTPPPKSAEDHIKRDKKRVEVGDPLAIYDLGSRYQYGERGYTQDHAKALELYHRAAELGHAESYANIGNAYGRGRGVEVDEKKASHYFELGAMKGCETARYNLGILEGNMDRALKHYTIAVRGGIAESLNRIQKLYKDGHATKEDYTKALRLYQTYLDEIKSNQRDEAAAADDDNQYY